MEREYMTYEQAAEHLHCSVPTLKVWVKNRRIPYYKIGRFVRFSGDDIRKYFDTHCRIDAA